VLNIGLGALFIIKSYEGYNALSSAYDSLTCDVYPFSGSALLKTHAAFLAKARLFNCPFKGKFERLWLTHLRYNDSILGFQAYTMRARQSQPTTKVPLPLREFLCFAVYSANHAFNRVYQPLLKKLGLTYPQFLAMILLWEQDAQTVGDLGERLFLQSNTLTPMLKRLEILGYIKRIRDLADERQVRIVLTAAGRKLHTRASDVVRSVRDATGLQDKQVKELTREITSLRKQLETQRSR
jgi:MarR family transcriptional regulator, organic hydroperoxide resistance regulator